MRRIQWSLLGVNKLNPDRWQTWREPLSSSAAIFRLQFLLNDDEWGVLEELGGGKLFLRCYFPELNAQGSTAAINIDRTARLIEAPVPSGLRSLCGRVYFQGVWSLNKQFSVENLDLRLSIEESIRDPS